MNTNTTQFPERCKAFFFDLDGVLVNSLPDITATVNLTLCRQNYPPISETAAMRYVGGGARQLLKTVLVDAAAAQHRTPPDFESPEYSTLFEQFLRDYAIESVKRSTLYPGVRELLNTLQSRHIPLAVVSNKPYEVTAAAIKKLDIDRYFDCVVCPEQVTHPKPHPEELEFALRHINSTRQLQLRAENVLMTGDSAGDIQAGKAFGAFTCAVRDGYGDKAQLLAQHADFMVEKAGDLLAALDKF